MPTPQQLEILDLRHFNARQLRPLLTEQSAVWHRRLRWEYRASTELLLGYLDARILPGYVALHRGKIAGYTFCVYEGSKAVIGDIYASAQNPSPLAVNHTLTRHLLETLRASPGISRIEAQLLLFDSGVLPPAFPGFTVFPRLFLELDLSLSQPAPVFPPVVEPLRWESGFYNETAELIHQSYGGHIDSDINDQYRTLAGSLRFLHNVIRFPGCGTFDPDSSFVLRETAAARPMVDPSQTTAQPQGAPSQSASSIQAGSTPSPADSSPSASSIEVRSTQSLGAPSQSASSIEVGMIPRRPPTIHTPGKIAAVVLVSRVAPDTAHITQLCVAPAHRGRGLGRQLFHLCLHHLPTRNYRALTLTVTEANHPAVALYAAAGFRARHRFDALVLDK